MKKIFFAILLSLMFGVATAGANQVDAARVGGYYRRSGTYVQPYYRTSPDRSRFNNYSTRGNYNPYTGSRGYVNPWR